MTAENQREVDIARLVEAQQKELEQKEEKLRTYIVDGYTGETYRGSNERRTSNLRGWKEK